MADTKSKYVGDEFVEEENIADEKGTELEGLYDFVLPPGVPQKLIIETMEKFNVEITVRKCAVQTIDVETDNLLVLRGELDAVNNAADYIYKKMSEIYNYKK